MKRAITELAVNEYDMLVIGAGIHGACIARDGAMRGLKVAIIEKGDFNSQTSHNSLKILHGGFRYIQHLNIKRIVESVNEQVKWLKLAPHLVKPLKCIMPTYGYGLRGPMALRIAIYLYEILARKRNKILLFPRGEVVSVSSCRQLVPKVKSKGLSGAAIWYDTQVFDADGLVIETIQSACEHHAHAANYIEATGFIRDGNQIKGVKALDHLTGRTLDIHAKMVVNAAGPFVDKVLAQDDSGMSLQKEFSVSMNIVTRKLFDDHAVAVYSQRSADAVVGAAKRLYFITPWKNCSIIGTSHFRFSGDMDQAHDAEKDEVKSFILEINAAYPGANLTINDVIYCYKGLTPAEDTDKKGEVGRTHKTQIIDHLEYHAVQGLLSVIGNKFTTARITADKTMDKILQKLGRDSVPCQTGEVPLLGASKATKTDPLTDEQFDSRCRQAICDEMALRLEDIIFRRTDLAMRGLLSKRHLQMANNILADELGWSKAQQQAEIDGIERHSWFRPC